MLSQRCSVAAMGLAVLLHVVQASDDNEPTFRASTVVAIALTSIIGTACLVVLGMICWKRRKAVKQAQKNVYYEGGNGSDDFDQYFGKQLQTVKSAPSIIIDINMPKSSRQSLANPPSRQVTLESLPSPSMAVLEDPGDTIAAIRSYRSLIQQQSMTEVNWMSPVESSRSMFPPEKEEEETLDWMSAIESSRTNQVFDTMRSDYDLEDASSDNASVNL